MGIYYQRYYVYNPVGNFEVTIPTLGAGIDVATVSIQAVDLGGEAVARETAFTLIICTDEDGTPCTTEQFTAVANTGIILADLTGGDAYQNKLLCVTDEDGIFEMDLTRVDAGTENFYFLITAPTGTYDVVGPLTYLAA